MALSGHWRSKNVRSASFSIFHKLLVLLPVVALAGCEPTTAQQPAPARPVLVTSVHYEPQVADRSFVGTIRPRIESDLGFRVAGKVSRRLVEVGALVESRSAAGDARRDRPQSCRPNRPRPSSARRPACLPRPSAAETRASELRQKGWSTDAQLDQAKAAADEARARLNRAQRSVELTKNSLSYATLRCRCAGGCHRNPGRARPGRRFRTDGHSRRAARRKGSRGRDTRNTY